MRLYGNDYDYIKGAGIITSEDVSDLNTCTSLLVTRRSPSRSEISVVPCHAWLCLILLLVGWRRKARFERVESQVTVVHVHRRIYVSVGGVRTHGIHSLQTDKHICQHLINHCNHKNYLWIVGILVRIVAAANRVDAGWSLAAALVKLFLEVIVRGQHGQVHVVRRRGPVPSVFTEQGIGKLHGKTLLVLLWLVLKHTKKSKLEPMSCRKDTH